MSTSFTAANQTDLLAALAAIATAQKPLGAPATAYTITLTATFAITGTLAIDIGAYGTTLTIANAGHVITGTGGLDITGQGRVILAGNNTFSGGVVLEGGTLELAAQAAAGAGTTLVQGGRSETLLVIDGTALPIIPIALGSGGYNNEVAGFYNLIDLPGIAATATYGIIDAFGVLSIPTATGTLRLRYAGSYSTPYGVASLQLIPDGHGGTMITSAFTPLAAAVTVIGVGGAIESIPFDDGLRNATVQSAIADVENVGVLAGIVVPFAVNGPIVPAFAAGTIEAFIHTAAAVALPDTPSILVSDAAGVVSVIGGAADNQLVLAGTGGVFFVSGTGQGSVVAGGGNSTVFIQPGNTGQYVDLGGGDDTIVASGGTNLLSPGRGHNMVWLGPGAAQIKSEGDDTIVGGTGNAVIDATKGIVPANDMAWLGGGGSWFYGGAGRSTVVSTTGNDFVSTTGGASQLWLGSGTDSVYANGADTIIGGAGSATVNITNNPGVLSFGGSGSLTVTNNNYYGSNVGTVVGGSGATTVNGTALIFGGSGSLVATGSTVYNGGYYAGTDTIVGGSGAATVSGVGQMIAGIGPLLFNANGSYSTLVTNPLGSATVNSGLGNYYQTSNLLLYANGSTFYSDPTGYSNSYYYYSGTSSDTIIGQSGALTVNGAEHANIIGSPAGHNVLTIGGGSTVTAGGDGDYIAHTGFGDMTYYAIAVYNSYYAPAPTYISLADGSETVAAAGNLGTMSIVGGSGADLIMIGNGKVTVAPGGGATTIVAGGNYNGYYGPYAETTTQEFDFTQGTGGTTLIQNFNSAYEYIHLVGYGANEAANALAGATFSGNDEIIALSDGTQLTFQNINNLSTSSFV